MSGRLVGEVHAWLRTTAARDLDLTVSERMVLSTIAERANEITREMWSYRGDDCTQFEYLRDVTGLGDKGLTKALNRLAERGLETRMKIGVTGAGKPIFAHRGKATKFKLPALPASAALPAEGVETPGGPVDNPPSGPVENPSGESPAAPESLPWRGPITPKASPTGDPIGPKASPGGDPNPYKEDPYKEDPYDRGGPQTTVTVEGAPPPTATPPARTNDLPMGFDAEYQDAVTTLTRFPDFGEQYIARAKTELGADVDRHRLYIRAAQFASEGIPA